MSLLDPTTTDATGPVPVAPPKRTERPHPLTPFIRGWVVLVALLFTLGREFVPDGTGNVEMPRLDLVLVGIGLIALSSGVSGYVSWRFTRFVIDDQELRIETGALFRSSQRIAFERVQSIDVVQPFAARLAGLAEMQIDVGADGATRLRYLKLARAYALRDYLLARARGIRETPVREATPGSVLEDLSAVDEVLVRVPPQTLVLAAITSHEFFLIIVGAVLSFGVALSLDMPVLAFGLAIPTVTALVGFVSKRVVGQFNYTLSRRAAGLRITRGLTSLTSQSVPNRRVQAIQISQSLLWRRLGLYRIDIEVVGWGAITTDEDQSGVNTILLPAGTIDQVRVALTALWPGTQVDAIELTPAPGRARRLHPFSGPFLAWGHNDGVVVTQHGWLVRRRQVVPHARAQSIRLTQGPLERRLGLANLEVHTAGMQITAMAVALDADQARAALPDLLARALRRDDHDVADALPVPASLADQAEETISSIE